MQAHAGDLRAEVESELAAWGWSDGDAFVHQFVDDWRACRLDSCTAALMTYAGKLTDDPAGVTARDVADLRAAGCTDAAIHDAAQVIAYFNYINRIADGLGVDAEDGLRQWGSGRAL